MATLIKHLRVEDVLSETSSDCYYRFSRARLCTFNECSDGLTTSEILYFMLVDRLNIGDFVDSLNSMRRSLQRSRFNDLTFFVKNTCSKTI